MGFIQGMWTRVAGIASLRTSTPEVAARRVRRMVESGDAAAALECCREAVERFPGSAALQRLLVSVRQAELTERLSRLKEELELSPCPEAFRELCELMLKRGEAAATLEHVGRWRQLDDSGEPLYFEAAAFGELYFGNHLSRDGMRAFQLAAEAGKLLKDDPRPFRLQFEIARRCGAWEDARIALARLLDIMPGNRLIEGRFRGVMANCASSRSLSKALADVERTGRFLGDEVDGGDGLDRDQVRPGLLELAGRDDVHVAFFLRGNTALVQGAQGASADRSARAIRDVVSVTRSSSRKLLLGTPNELRCEGSGGSLFLKTGSNGTAAVWAARNLTGTSSRLMDELVGSPAVEEAA
ncbi:MAG: hypothetical protein ISQ11_12715 [Planctomycetes bacterium]|nr:hypothetical protein [Planctomycetota bacterium]